MCVAFIVHLNYQQLQLPRVESVQRMPPSGTQKAHRMCVTLFQGTNGPRPTYTGNSGQGKSGARGPPPVGGNMTAQQTSLGGSSIYRGSTWAGGASPYPSLRYPAPMGPTNAAYTHQPAVSWLSGAVPAPYGDKRKFSGLRHGLYPQREVTNSTVQASCNCEELRPS